METTSIINIIVPIAAAIGGGFIKSLYSMITDLRLNIKELDEKIQSTYARKDDFKEAIGDLRDMFHRIMDKLDDKADK